MNPAQLITYLNSIEIGEMAQIRGKLGEARKACNELSQHQLAEQIDPDLQSEVADDSR